MHTRLLPLTLSHTHPHCAGIHDFIRMSLGLPAAYVPIAGRLGSNALMQLDDYEYESYFSKHPKVYQVRTTG